MRKIYLDCYDICDDRRLHKVQTMRGFGDRLQYSVFECQLTAADSAVLSAINRGFRGSRPGEMRERWGGADSRGPLAATYGVAKEGLRTEPVAREMSTAAAGRGARRR